MYQQWRDLLFLHWEFPVAQIQATLPDGLFVDTYMGKAYLGLVPFFMQNIRPRLLPAVPAVSNFMEVNLRTYVYDRAGVPGVWFYSLDANQRLAVAIARRFFHLPYHLADMNFTRTPGRGIRYETQRRNAAAAAGLDVFEYTPGANLPPPAPASLEFFLIERYRLYASAGGQLWRGAVAHPPYALSEAKVPVWSEHLLRLNGFAPTQRPPDHAVMSRGVDVNVLPLERQPSNHR
jgi:uncharacterized protein YqjF (DUF2071 family)